MCGYVIHRLKFHFHSSWDLFTSQHPTESYITWAILNVSIKYPILIIKSYDILDGNDPIRCQNSESISILETDTKFKLSIATQIIL